MSTLSGQPARPRTRALIPAYPTALAAGLMLASCAGSPATTASTPSSALLERPASVILVRASAPTHTGRAVPDDSPAPPAPPLDLLAGVTVPEFPEDDLEHQLMIGCGGGCPPAYVLETEHRDNGQLDARLKFCQQLARPHVPHMSGTLSVRAHIDASGKARSVTVESNGDLPATLESCVQRLVESAVYSSRYNYERDAAASLTIKD